MEDFVSVLDQLNTFVFDSADDVREKLDALYEEGLTYSFDEDNEVFQLTDLASSQSL